MDDAIRIKPHHFIDIIAAVGRGQTVFQPHPYGHAVHTVAHRVLADRDVLLEIDPGADAVCAPCRHNVDGLCDDTIDTSFRPLAPSSKRAYNLLIDQRWCERLGLSAGDRLSARMFCRRLRDHLDACGDDITDVYRETPPERTAQRVADVRAGIDALLSDRATQGPT